MKWAWKGEGVKTVACVRGVEKFARSEECKDVEEQLCWSLLVWLPDLGKKLGDGLPLDRLRIVAGILELKIILL